VQGTLNWGLVEIEAYWRPFPVWVVLLGLGLGVVVPVTAYLWQRRKRT
jgi:hypothetical protein